MFGKFGKFGILQKIYNPIWCNKRWWNDILSQWSVWDMYSYLARVQQKMLEQHSVPMINFRYSNSYVLLFIGMDPKTWASMRINPKAHGA